MTAPPGYAPVLDQRTSPREDVSAFESACARRDYGALQSAISALSKRDAVAHLGALFPHLSEWWIRRHLGALMAIGEDEFWRLAYADPTGERAVRLVMREAA